MQYILNSAVITSYGTYTYRPMTVTDAAAWLHQHADAMSTIAYPETATALETLCGLEPGTVGVSRQVIQMRPGEAALVFRLVFPTGYRPDPAEKGRMGLEFITRNHELGLLTRVS